MSEQGKLPVGALSAMVCDMHAKTPAEQLAIQAALLASLPQEVREVFAKIKAEAESRPPRPIFEAISVESLDATSAEDADLTIYEYVERQLAHSVDRPTALVSFSRGEPSRYLSELPKSLDYDHWL